VTVALALLARLPTLHVTIPACLGTTSLIGCAEMKVHPGGNES